MRREFDLSEEDDACLRARGLTWEAVREGQAKLLIFPEYPVPAAYNHRVVKAGLRLPPSYPDDQIDMVYFSPPLALTSGKAIRQLSMQPFDGGQYQQWSRHRTRANPWRPGVDNVGTHLILVDSWLERER
jgi:hypothetical protein